MTVYLEDTSSNGTFLNKKQVNHRLTDQNLLLQIGKGNKVELKNGDEFFLLQQTDGQVALSEEIGFIFMVVKDYSKKADPPVVVVEVIKEVEKEAK